MVLHFLVEMVTVEEVDTMHLVMVGLMEGMETVQMGGKGTGMDISTYPFDNFKLSPGGGGLHYTFGGLFGGGGGGVLINNEGPEMIFSKAGVQWSVGEGRDRNKFLGN